MQSNQKVNSNSIAKDTKHTVVNNPSFSILIDQNFIESFKTNGDFLKCLFTSTLTDKTKRPFCFVIAVTHIELALVKALFNSVHVASGKNTATITLVFAKKINLKNQWMIYELFREVSLCDQNRKIANYPKLLTALDIQGKPAFDTSTRDLLAPWTKRLPFRYSRPDLADKDEINNRVFDDDNFSKDGLIQLWLTKGPDYRNSVTIENTAALEAATLKGNLDAIAVTGLCKIIGADNEELDTVEGYKLIKESAEQQCVVAEFILGIIYLKVEGFGLAEPMCEAKTAEDDYQCIGSKVYDSKATACRWLIRAHRQGLETAREVLFKEFQLSVVNRVTGIEWLNNINHFSSRARPVTIDFISTTEQNVAIAAQCPYDVGRAIGTLHAAPTPQMRWQAGQNAYTLHLNEDTGIIHICTRGYPLHEFAIACSYYEFFSERFCDSLDSLVGEHADQSLEDAWLSSIVDKYLVQSTDIIYPEAERISHREKFVNQDNHARYILTYLPTLMDRLIKPLIVACVYPAHKVLPKSKPDPAVQKVAVVEKESKNIPYTIDNNDTKQVTESIMDGSFYQSTHFLVSDSNKKLVERKIIIALINLMDYELKKADVLNTLLYSTSFKLDQKNQAKKEWGCAESVIKNHFYFGFFSKTITNPYPYYKNQIDFYMRYFLLLSACLPKDLTLQNQCNLILKYIFDEDVNVSVLLKMGAKLQIDQPSVWRQWTELGLSLLSTWLITASQVFFTDQKKSQEDKENPMQTITTATYLDTQGFFSNDSDHHFHFDAEVPPAPDDESPRNSVNDENQPVPEKSKLESGYSLI